MTSYKATDAYATAHEQIDALFSNCPSPQALFEGVCDILNQTVPTYTWVGIYLVEGPDLVLAAWRGPAPTEHVRIPIGQGICGYAAANAESIVVPDVSVDPRYLQCFLNTRSEIVVPIIHQAKVYGEIDIDSNQLNAFSQGDKEFLEGLAARIGAAIARAG